MAPHDGGVRPRLGFLGGGAGFLIFGILIFLLLLFIQLLNLLLDKIKIILRVNVVRFQRGGQIDGARIIIDRLLPQAFLFVRLLRCGAKGI